MDSEIFKITDCASELCVDKLCKQLRPENFFAPSIGGEPEIFGMAGFEPMTSCSQSKRSSQAELHPEKIEERILPYVAGKNL